MVVVCGRLALLFTSTPQEDSIHLLKLLAFKIRKVAEKKLLFSQTQVRLFNASNIRRLENSHICHSMHTTDPNRKYTVFLTGSDAVIHYHLSRGKNIFLLAQ